MLVAWV